MANDAGQQGPEAPTAVVGAAARRVAALGLVATAVALVPPLAVPAVVVTLLLALSFPAAAPPRWRTRGRVAIAIAAVSAAIGLFRFATRWAMHGIVAGGQNAAAGTAMSRLREIVTAEDMLRRAARWDPDGDHVGSAALVGALAGTSPLRGDTRMEPLLNYAFRDSVDTPLGPATRVEGYLFVVCLPTPGGGWTARPGDAVDEDLAERRYVAYAWPADRATGMTTAFFSDEHERLLERKVGPGEAAPYFGAAGPPACDAALSGPDAARWKPWKGKKPREHLPGE